MAKQHKLSRHETTILKILAQGNRNAADNLDAADFQVEIVSLLMGGLITLSGKLSAPKFQATDAGVDVLAPEQAKANEQAGRAGRAGPPMNGESQFSGVSKPYNG
jgi:hypothetical protein